MRQHVKDRLLLAAAGAGLLLGARAAIKRARAYDFRGKTVLITGGSRGLGLEIARQFVRENARVAICARDATELAIAADELRSMGGEVVAVTCDAGDRAQVQQMFEQLAEQFGAVDVLVNSVGIIGVGPLESMTLDDFEEAMRINYWAPLYCCLAAIPGMRERGDGRIVNIASIGGKISVPHLLPYSASKFALVGFSRGLRSEVAKDGIVVTTVCPGLMRTGSPRNANFKGRHQEEYAWFKISDSQPLTAMSSVRAAAQVVDACRYGYAEVVLSVQAKLAVKFEALFPEWDAAALSLANSLLPEPGGVGTETAKGFESESDITRSPITAPGDRSAERNNEI